MRTASGCDHRVSAVWEGETLSLGGLMLSACAAIPFEPEPAGSPYVPFLRAGPPAGRADHHAELTVADGPMQAAKGVPLFEADSWRLFMAGNARTMEWGDPGTPPLWRIDLSSSLDHSITTVSPPWLRTPDSGPCCRSPMRYPADQIILMYLLAGRGVTIHAAGVALGGRSVVLAGCSGAGKTTLTRTLMQESRLTVLSDDRVIMRHDEGRFRAYGTPWAGEAQVSADECADLTAVAFIQHATDCRIERLSPRVALTRLMPVVSVPLYESGLVGPCMALIDQLVSGVAFYDLHIPADGRALDPVLELLRG